MTVRKPFGMLGSSFSSRCTSNMLPSFFCLPLYSHPKFRRFILPLSSFLFLWFHVPTSGFNVKICYDELVLVSHLTERYGEMNTLEVTNYSFWVDMDLETKS